MVREELCLRTHNCHGVDSSPEEDAVFQIRAKICLYQCVTRQLQSKNDKRVARNVRASFCLKIKLLLWISRRFLTGTKTTGPRQGVLEVQCTPPAFRNKYFVYTYMDPEWQNRHNIWTVKFCLQTWMLQYCFCLLSFTKECHPSPICFPELSFIKEHCVLHYFYQSFDAQKPRSHFQLSEVFRVKIIDATYE